MFELREQVSRPSERLHLFAHLPDCISLGNSKYHFENFAPDPEKVELYSSTEAVLNNALEVTCAPRAIVKDESAEITVRFSNYGYWLASTPIMSLASCLSHCDVAWTTGALDACNRKRKGHHPASHQVPSASQV
ncbi:hypothetical protein BDR03DRAFT_500645 [Suillus americanus]|nr:hypothetical protein BDR03DRAFT_500645 [Suillus americanus]